MTTKQGNECEGVKKTQLEEEEEEDGEEKKCILRSELWRMEGNVSMSVTGMSWDWDCSAFEIMFMEVKSVDC